MEIEIAVLKTNKFDSPESGDTLEVIERPGGGVSVVLCDGRSSGRKAKAISSMVVHRVIDLLADGVRDGAAARAASDHLYTEKDGAASAFLNILSVDLQTGTIVITRNNPTPIYIVQREKTERVDSNSIPIGTSRNIRPDILEFPLEPDTTVIMFTDGLVRAGSPYGLSFDICTLLEAMLEEQEPTAQELADTIMQEAIRLDQGRPNDDMSLVVLRVLAHETGRIRRMVVKLPVILSDTSLG